MDTDTDKEDKEKEDKEKEEEEAFLVSLYKFMRERHTPIERIPHLGFKQSMSPPYGDRGRWPCVLLTLSISPLFPVNLWKIYKAVEKLGAYELVSGACGSRGVPGVPGCPFGGARVPPGYPSVPGAPRLTPPSLPPSRRR